LSPGEERATCLEETFSPRESVVENVSSKDRRGRSAVRRMMTAGSLKDSGELTLIDKAM
jgi:hypothetical protein